MNQIYIVIIVSLISFGFLHLLKNKKVGFGIRTLIAMLLGAVIGTIFKENTKLLYPIGSTYVSLIKMVVIPLVMSTIISSMTSLKNPKQLKSIGFKTITSLLLTTAAATIVGIIVGNLMKVGKGMNFIGDASFKAKEVPSFVEVLMNMVPKNPIASMAEGKIIPVVVFSLFLATAIIIEGHKNPNTVKAVKEFIDSFEKIMFRITKMIMKLTPYGVLSLLATVSSEYGLEVLLPLIKVIIALYIACFLHIILVHGGLLTFVVKVNPLRFFKKIYPAQVVAFSTQSSYGTLPVTLKVLTDNVKISEKIASFTAPMGATIGMNACGGIYPAIVAVFVANIFNLNLTFSHYVLLVFTTIISSIGIAGVPGTATMAAVVVLSTLGLPIEGLGMLLGIDVILDMARTMTNVTGAAVTTLIVANSEKEFDRHAFNSNLDKELEISA
ncbi:amino acid:proton symporter [Fervidicella metallireducens AeB]|uniref:Amino acid:proton symporter n=1 Tax=Fervidicella metallireducens AeB TaxID=1403537 RepID=A0A017RW05_9CLOT|nr:dicarboxylate/amino acid:cation symporter [Fervidicella metallireducens]EYE88872.1 amino acid:proton symporter [Fervidicella metallireducens AeB]